MSKDRPPIGEKIEIQVFDRWQREGQERKNFIGTFNGKDFLIDGGGRYPANMVIGWSLINCQ